MTSTPSSATCQFSRSSNGDSGDKPAFTQVNHHFYHHLDPRRPMRWARQQWSSFFSGDTEAEKVVVQKGYKPSLRHVWVHIPPTIATAVLLGMNLWSYSNTKVRGHYIGASIPGDLEDETKLNWLQFAAKLHEITIVASLSTAAWDIVRYFLMYRPLGVPLGLLGASSAFTEMKFLFSKELHGIWRMEYGKKAKISVFFTIFLFCIMANLAGPSSAILLIPRNSTWPVAEYRFSINGTGDRDLWPQILTKDHIGGANCSGADAEAHEKPHCVAGAYRPIGHYFRSFVSYPSDGSFEFNAIDSRTARTLHGNTRNSITHYSETWSMAPHAAAVVVHEELRTIWSKRLNGVPNNYRNAFLRTIMVNTTSPVVRTACVPARNISTAIFNSSSDSESLFAMDFPILQEDDFWVPSSVSGFGSGPTSRVNLSASLLDLTDSIIDNRNFIVKTTWVSLPEAFSSSTSAGLLILMSASNANYSHPSRFNLAMGCAIDARWAPSGNIVASSQSDWAWAGYHYPTKTSALERRANPDDQLGRIYKDRLFLPGREDTSQWKRVTSISQDWLQALTPPIPGRRGSATTMDAIFEDTIPNLWAVAEHPSLRAQVELYHDPVRYELLVLAEHVTASLVADGASRLGLGMQAMIWDLERPLENVGLSPEDHGSRQGVDDFSLGAVALPAPYNGSGTELVMLTEVYGYGLRVEGVSGWLAVTVVCMHLLFVVVHVFCVWYFFRNETTTTWKSSAEMLLLGLSSAGVGRGEDGDKMQEMLRYGAVGAEKAATLSCLVRVEALGDEESSVQYVKLRLGKGDGKLGRLQSGKLCVASGLDTR